MKRKWKDLSKLQRKMLVFIGLLNFFVFLVQIFSGFWLSWWFCGIGFGGYFFFILDCFGYFIPSSVSSECPMLDCSNFSCIHYLEKFDVCRYSQVPIEDSVFRSLILQYVDLYGIDRLYALINGKTVSEVSGDE